MRACNIACKRLKDETSCHSRHCEPRTAASLAGGIMSAHRTRGPGRVVAVPLGIAAAVTSSIAIAQQPPTGNLEEVVVTGSRIARPNLESAVPVTTVSADEIYETG